MGSSTKEADIVLIDNDFQLVIEMKQPGITLEDKQSSQLISYMRILGCNYGLLVGNKFKYFYDYDHSKNPYEIKEIVCLDFVADDKDGVAICDILDKANCSNDKLYEYSKTKIEKLQKMQLINRLKKDLTSNNCRKIKDIIKNNLELNGYDEEVISNIINDIIISFHKLNSPPDFDHHSLPPSQISFLDDIMSYYNSICDKNFICYGNKINYRQIAIMKTDKTLHYEFILRKNTHIGIELHLESKEHIRLNDVISSFTGKIRDYIIGHRMVKGKDYIQVLVPVSDGKEECSIIMKELISLTYDKICNEYKAGLIK